METSGICLLVHALRPCRAARRQLAGIRLRPVDPRRIARATLAPGVIMSHDAGRKALTAAVTAALPCRGAAAWSCMSGRAPGTAEDESRDRPHVALTSAGAPASSSLPPFAKGGPVTTASVSRACASRRTRRITPKTRRRRRRRRRGSDARPHTPPHSARRRTPFLDSSERVSAPATRPRARLASRVTLVSSPDRKHRKAGGGCARGSVAGQGGPSACLAAAPCSDGAPWGGMGTASVASVGAILVRRCLFRLEPTDKTVEKPPGIGTAGRTTHRLSGRLRASGGANPPG